MDKKAKSILFKTYWSSAGWISEHKRTITPEDFEYAKSKGVMFDRLNLPKNELLQRLNGIVHHVPLKKITDAFLSGFSNDRPDWRSGLSSFANAHRILKADTVPDFYLGYGYNVDINILNFERIKWGGVRHFQGVYNLVDLELLMKETIPAPAEEDIQQLKTLLQAVENSEPDETASKLRDRLKSILSLPKSEIGCLLETLGSAEIILPTRFDRKIAHKNDWHFMTHWRGEDRYNKTACAYYFGSYGIE